MIVLGQISTNSLTVSENGGSNPLTHEVINNIIEVKCVDAMNVTQIIMLNLLMCLECMDWYIVIIYTLFFHVASFITIVTKIAATIALYYCNQYNSDYFLNIIFGVDVFVLNKDERKYHSTKRRLTMIYVLSNIGQVFGYYYDH